MRRFLIALCLMVLPLAAQAQTYPDYSDLFVNDFADLLPGEAQARIRADLRDLKSDTGVEMTVLTLRDQASYAPRLSLEQFATNLFNEWGIGDAAGNDGILVLVISGDRTMRIELGAGYGRDWDRAAQRVVDRVFLPAFRDGDYATGLTEGVRATISDIARPAAEGAPAPAGDGMKPGWIVAIIGAVLALYLVIQRLFKPSRTCPQCGTRRALVVDRHETGEKEARETTSCRKCDHQTSRVIPFYMLENNSSTSGNSGGSFGGGSSGGGGGSGGW